MDEHRVIVKERGTTHAVLELRQHNREWTVPLGPSFGAMLIADESCPTHSAYLKFRDGQFAVDDDFHPAPHLRSMRITETLAPMEDEDHGGVLVRLDADLEGLFAHWEPGAAWGTTAYDELGDCVHFDGTPDAPREWSR